MLNLFRSLFHYPELCVYEIIYSYNGGENFGRVNVPATNTYQAQRAFDTDERFEKYTRIGCTLLR